MNHFAKTNSTWKEIIGLSFTPQSFYQYCTTLEWRIWKPSGIVLHNTATPMLMQRPLGFTPQHIQNLITYYRNTKKWSAGPHIFIDDKQIWVFTPLTVFGVHSPSWNNTTLGIEMLGNYETENFSNGRGLQVRKNTISAIATLMTKLDMQPDALKLHLEDPLTTHNCPGKNVGKAEMILEIRKELHKRSTELYTK